MERKDRIEELDRSLDEESVIQRVGINESEILLRNFRNATFSKRFRKVEADYKAFLEQHPQIDTGFNIFEVLGIHGREVKTHSAFLSELLNPIASHKKGSLFLEGFLSYCQTSLKNVIEDGLAQPRSFPDLTNKEMKSFDWLVSHEYTTIEHGRLDILIRNEELKFLCVIENKIHAYESKDQLKSYWEWLSDPDRKNKYKHRILIFLTPCGRKSDYPVGTTYYPMSYKNDITSWLQAVISEVDSLILKGIIEQYLATIGRIARCDDE